jgi:recombination protein RecA
VGDILDLGVIQGILKKSGAFYSYGETRLGQGREAAKEFLTQHPEIAGSVEARIRAQGPSAVRSPAPAGAADPEDTGLASDALLTSAVGDAEEV